MAHLNYKLPFGMHKGKVIQDLPHDYITGFLVAKKVYEGKETLRAALISGGYLSPSSNLLTPPSTPMPATRKRQAPQDNEVSPSTRRKLAYNSAAKDNGTMLNYNGSAYILDFGRHAGTQLCDVPATYISYLIEEGVYKKRLDLATALREQGFLHTDSPFSSQEPAPRPVYQQTAWQAPSIHETIDPRFFRPHKSTPRWISDADALYYFGLGKTLLSERGVSLVTEVDLLRDAPHSDLIDVFMGAKRWLYQVYSCAVSFGSVPSRWDTADEALRGFLENRRGLAGRHELE